MSESETAALQPTSEGKRLIDEWIGAQEHERQCRSALIRAECDRVNAMTALGKWMCPDDAKAWEKFCVWYGDNLIQVTVIDKVNANFEVTVRTRGKRGLR